MIIPADDGGGSSHIQDLLTNRWNAVTALFGMELQVVKEDTTTQLIASYGDQQSPYKAFIAIESGNPSPTYEVAAAAGQQIYARYANDPVLSYNNLPLNGIASAALQDRYNEKTRQTILNARIGTIKYDKAGIARLESVPLAWTPDGGGFYYLSNLFTVMYTGRLYANLLEQYISNFKFHDTSAEDGTPVPPGAVSLQTIRANCISLYATLVGQAIAEDLDTFVANISLTRPRPSELAIVLPINIGNAIRNISITLSWTQ